MPSAPAATRSRIVHRRQSAVISRQIVCDLRHLSAPLRPVFIDFPTSPRPPAFCAALPIYLTAFGAATNRLCGLSSPRVQRRIARRRKPLHDGRFETHLEKDWPSLLEVAADILRFNTRHDPRSRFCNRRSCLLINRQTHLAMKAFRIETDHRLVRLVGAMDVECEELQNWDLPAC